MKPRSVFLAAFCALLCAADMHAAALTLPLAPGVSLELDVAGSGDGAFLVSPQPVSKAQFQAFAAQSGYKTEAERGTSGGFGYDAVTKTAVQRPGFSWRDPGFEQAPNNPVVDVTRDDALAFLAWASRKTGRVLSLPSVRRWEMAVASHPLEKSSRPGTSVREWTTDTAPSSPGQPPRAILRGASWLQDAAKPDPAQLSNAASPGSRRPDFGFRACAENTPANAPVAHGAIVNEQPVQNQLDSSTAATPGGSQPVRTTVSTNEKPAGKTSVGPIAWAALLILIALPILVVVALVVAVVKAFSGKGTSATKQTPPSRWGTGSQFTATATRGGIQVRAGVPSGTPIRVTWANGPAGGMVVPYQPGPQGMFVPVEGIITNPRAVPIAPEGIVPEAAVTPVDGGFRVSGSVPDGTTIHGYWTDASGNSQTGNARYDGTNRFAFFRTQSPAARIAVSLRPISTPTNFSANPPPDARQAAAGAYSSNPTAGIHYYQDDSNFWTGFWLSDVLGGSNQPPPLYPNQGYDPLNQGIGGQTLFDDQPGNISQPGNWLPGGEPPAYH